MDKIKLTPKQVEVIQKMREGWAMFISQSDENFSISYFVTYGNETIYFRSDVFGKLLQNELIYQEYRHHNWILTTKGETIELPKKRI